MGTKTIHITNIVGGNISIKFPTKITLSDGTIETYTISGTLDK